MDKRDYNIIKHQRGYALPAVLMFLMLAFGVFAVIFRSSASSIRIEQARVLRQSRIEWTAPAIAQGLRLLETGAPPLENYQCIVTLTQGAQTKYFLLTFDHVSGTRWTLHCQPSPTNIGYPEAPATF